MKSRYAQLLLLLFLCSACGLVPNTSGQPTVITLEDAIDRGFPIYVPSNTVLQSMEISTSPTFSLNSEGRNCTYLSINFPYENTPTNQDNEKPAINMLVSDGCAYPAWRGYPAELTWAVEGRAIRVGEDFVDELPPIILFEEPSEGFQYVVFSEESLANTMQLLESMTLVRQH